MVPQAFDREAAIEELNQMLTISDRELKYNRDQAKPVQQVAEELADYHFD